MKKFWWWLQENELKDVLIGFLRVTIIRFLYDLLIELKEKELISESFFIFIENVFIKLEDENTWKRMGKLKKNFLFIFEILILFISLVNQHFWLFWLLFEIIIKRRF